MRFELEPLACFRRLFELLRGPFRPHRRFVTQVRGRERRELGCVRRVHGDELTLQVRRELADDDVGVGELARDVVAVRLAFGRELEVEQLGVGRYLHAALRHRFELVERRRSARKLRQEYRGAFHPKGTSSALPRVACRV